MNKKKLYYKTGELENYGLLDNLFDLIPNNSPVKIFNKIMDKVKVSQIKNSYK